ncbi:hypothetical protein HIM_06286 [Hirsutella minnesotensis 3608]|uniref:Peptidase A1 domain-containing protein n=1 Tax=Hirsutella minnesotensis 3608 TaxID=1043627 RepID=A0A0F7ZNS9_9HYPO|nr:hypothetical protein HIM_06286 [Hirsutella minnesotensis 3608]
MRPKKASVLLTPALLVATQDCFPGPISIPLINATLANGKSRRGVNIKVGTPQQEFAFLPKWDNNNTFLYGSECDSVELTHSNDACKTFRGGVYEDKSDSKGTLASSSVKPPPDLWSSKTYDIFTETLDLGGNNSLRNFPLAAPKNYKDWNLQAYDPQNIIGLGPGSTLIEACRKAGRIASDSIGFYWGLDGVLDKDQTTGSFVLGGFDKGKTYGNGRTEHLTDQPDCPSRMAVTLRDIVLNFPNGTDASIFPKENGGEILAACIIPERPSLMDMPLTPYFYNLLQKIGNEEWSRSTGVDWWNVILNPALPLFQGDLTLVLNNDLQIRIPNHQLIFPKRYIDKDGNLAVNSSQPVLRINSLQNTTANVLPVIGRYFFTSAYLFLNRDAQQFTLWQANPTSEENLVPVNSKNEVVPIAPGCTIHTETSPRPNPKGDQGIKQDENRQTESPAASLSPGAIAGIAVAGAALVAIAVGVIWWFRLRRRKRDASVDIVGPGARQDEHERLQELKTSAIGWPSQGYPHFIPQEMPSQSTNQTAELPAVPVTR